MTATAQFSRPIIVGIVSLAAVVRFLTSLARRKEIKSALMNQRESYRKLLVKRRMVKAMPDILIRGMVEMPPSCSDCPIRGDAYCRLTREKVKYHHEYRHDRCPLHALPEHGELIDRDALPEGRLEWEDIDDAPVIVPSNKEETE